MGDFQVGEVVDVRNCGRAEVVEPLVTDPAARFYGRVRVKYQADGKTYYARPENLRTTVQVKQRVLLCHSTTHYRTCAASVVNWNDAVLEVGSHEGKCTWLLSRRCRYIVGVDKSATTIEAARRRYPGLRFEAVDGFDVPALQALGPPDGSGFSVVLVDIGGIASLSTVAALVGLYYKEFPYNTKIVVKSVFLKRMVEDSLPYNTEKDNPWAMLGGAAAASAAAGGGGDGGGAARAVGSERVQATPEDDLGEEYTGEEPGGEDSEGQTTGTVQSDGKERARGGRGTGGAEGGMGGGKQRGRRGHIAGGRNSDKESERQDGARSTTGPVQPRVGSRGGVVASQGEGDDLREDDGEGPCEGTPGEGAAGSGGALQTQS